MTVFKSWILGPFQRHAKRRRSPYVADQPDDSPPRDDRDSYPNSNEDRSSGGHRSRIRGLPQRSTGFALELERVKTNREDFAEEEEEDLVRDYNAPVHMWVVATLFPIIAGTFGPMASMFNICAIAIEWRLVVKIPEGQNHEAIGRYIHDPVWLVVVNVLSLVFAIIANLSLLGQMTNRIRYNISGPITILGFYISGFMDIVLVAIAPTYMPLPDTPHATWSQAFYYAALSGSIYVLLAAMLSVTGYGIWFGRYSQQFKLSLSQRSLMLQTMMFLGYILVSGAIYSKLEGWDYLDATYFVVVTLFTIGFGDLVPTTHLARSLFFPMAVGGILYVGVIVANVRALVLESGSVKISTRMVEQARRRAIRSGNLDDGTIKTRREGRIDIHGGEELERRRKEFRVMRAVQKEAQQNNRVFSLIFATLAFCILWFIGAVVFWQAEMSTGGQNWTYFESVYFTFVSQLTIGYGDFEPQTNSAKPAFVFWALIALPTLTVLIGAVGDSITDFVNWYTVFIGRNAQLFMRAIRQLRGKQTEDPRKVAERIRAQRKADEKGFNKIADVDSRSTVPLELETSDLNEQEKVAAEDAYRPLMMLRAANKIVSHLDEDPPTRYTYEEWAWLLKLVGEDEEEPDQHRRVGIPLRDGASVVTPLREHKDHVWSWLGQESPLMSLEDAGEPKWILKRLMRILERDLKARAERHVQHALGHQLTRKGSQIKLGRKGSFTEPAFGSEGEDEATLGEHKNLSEKELC